MSIVSECEEPAITSRVKSARDRILREAESSYQKNHYWELGDLESVLYVRSCGFSAALTSSRCMKAPIATHPRSQHALTWLLGWAAQ